MTLARINKTISTMEAPALLVNNSADLFYLTGVNLDGFWLLLTKNGVFALAPVLLSEQLEMVLLDAKIIATNDFLKSLIELLKKEKISKLGINTRFCGYSFVERLKKKVKIVDSGNVITQQRQIKDADEVALIRKSCQIAKGAAAYAQKIIKPGISEEQISYKIDEYFAKNGVKASFPTIVASGPNSAWPHHVNTGRKLQKDDIVVLDLGCVYKGYCSDLTRTLFLGKINRLHKKIYSLVRKAKISATRAVKSGIKAKKVDALARNVIKKGGYGDRFIHSTGHGVGLEVHELPSLGRKSKHTLRRGMVVTVEPGIYLPGSFGVRLEDTVIVTERGCEVLTDD